MASMIAIPLPNPACLVCINLLVIRCVLEDPAKAKRLTTGDLAALCLF